VIDEVSSVFLLNYTDQLLFLLPIRPESEEWMSGDAKEEEEKILTATQTADTIIIAAPNKLKRGGIVSKNTNSNTIE
jgi:hypothetical protein